MHGVHQQNQTPDEEYTSPTNLKATPRPPAGLMDGRHLGDLADAQRVVKEKEDALKQAEEAECDSASEKAAKIGAAKHALEKVRDLEVEATRAVWPESKVYRTRNGAISIDH